MAHVLEDLCKKEEQRHTESTEALKGVRSALGNVFRAQAKSFLKALVAQFEAIVTLVDALPLPMHFAKLDHDDNANDEEEREEVSLKRRMRREGGHLKPEDGALPPRVWEGIPLNKIQVDEKRWPEDEDTKRAKAALEAMQESSSKDKAGKLAAKAANMFKQAVDVPTNEVSPSVASYRSPFHKQLFKSRNECYDQFQKLFQDEMAERHKHWTEKEAQEKDLVRSWSLNIKQLKKHSEANQEDE